MRFIPISIISASLLLGAPLTVQANTNKAESLHKAFEEIDKQSCDDRKSVVEKSLVYSACTANVGGRDQFRFISVSSSIVETGDGIGYWYYPNGKVVAIRFFHTDELFMFDGDGKLQAELIRAQKVMVNGQEQFQNRSIRTNFDQEERDRLEKLAKGGGEDILSKFRSKSKQMAPKTVGTANLCNKAIRQGTIRLESIPNVTIVTRNTKFAPLLSPYPNVEAGLNRRYTFALSGSGVANVWKAPEMRLEIARQIINSCAGVAAVTFARNGTGESGTVGLFPDGSIKPFACAGDFDPRTRKRIPPITWGRQACDI